MKRPWVLRTTPRLRLSLLAALFLLAACSAGSQQAIPTLTPTSTPTTATATVTPRPAVTTPPTFDGTIAGIRLGPDVDRGGSIVRCDGSPQAVRLADAVRSPLNPIPATLPAGAVLDLWLAVECDGKVVSAEASFSLRGNRTMQIFRFRGEPVFRGAYPADAVQRVTVGGREGIGVTLHADGQSAILLREPWGLTTIRASAINVDELAQIASDLRPDHAAGLDPSMLRILDAAGPGLTDVVVQLLAADAQQVMRMMLPITAQCGRQGELFEHCRLDGKKLTDTYVGHVVTDLLHCEGCVAPPAVIEEWPLDDRGLLFSGVWRVDEDSQQLVAEAVYPLDETPVEFVLAFSAPGLPQWEVMFFIDPEADYPIRFAEVQTGGWTSADTIDEIGGSWTPLVVDETPPAGGPAALHLTAEALRVVIAAQDAVADWLGTDDSGLSLDSVVRVEWQDGCLGVQRPGQTCSDAAVSGYRVRISLVGEASYQVHSNLDASQLVWTTDWIVQGTFYGTTRHGLLTIEGDFPNALDEQYQQFVIMSGSDISILDSLKFGDPVLVAGDGRPSSDVPLMIWVERDPDIVPPEASDPDRIGAAAVAAMGTLLSAGGLDLGSMEPAEWPDTCLGVPRPGESCASAIVPGFAIEVTHTSGTSYHIRTDLEGRQFVWVGELAVEGVVTEVVVATTIEVEADTGERYRARVVDGSTIGRLASLDRVRRDERVKITLARDPNGSGWVIVTLDLAGQQ